MVYFFIILICILQSSIVFCGGKISKLATGLRTEQSYSLCSKANDEEPEQAPHEYSISRELRSSTIIDGSSMNNQIIIANPKEDHILQACGLAMNEVLKMAQEESKSSARMEIVIEIDYNPTSK